MNELAQTLARFRKTSAATGPMTGVYGQLVAAALTGEGVDECIIAYMAAAEPLVSAEFVGPDLEPLQEVTNAFYIFYPQNLDQVPEYLRYLPRNPG